ncbi:hypothetical protein Ngar_c16140 [Candidatus Nitrososphaera gargensis Ga9.2]|uniref:Uncharacterized protein n=1 Tax=Nitrososphaera gargensis (strain Ga9.2) TaxID=1237085 RepID=K0IJV0_NITGG|nr:UPF0182 family protein [Candidatus Nitrososphaera gargensis]AFU58547.1 hypothetical protein Ngar_c16140 [Candidatus Nitrososphaera gargensis Ga9.2]
MWDTYNEDRARRTDIGRIVRIAVFAAIGVIIFGLVSNQSVNLLMNLEEFGEVFTKPLYYSILSGIILAAIVFVRVNFKARHSATWYSIKMLINFLKRGDYESQSKMSRYSEFQMGKTSFAFWQLTKVVLFAPLFANIMFGMAAEYIIQGNDIGLSSIGNIFAIPFADITTDGSYAQQNVMPMFPALTLLIPPLLAAVGLRLLLYVGVTSVVNIASQYAIDSKESKPKFLSYISTIEIIAGAAVFWIGFNMFFSINIDYNTRYAIAGAMTLGAAFITFGFVDRRHAKVIIYPTKRLVYSRLFTAAVIIGLAGSIMIVNNSIAETRKIEWNGPYIAQQIEVNRFMHGLDKIETKNYDIAQPPVSPSAIQSVVEQNGDVLGNIRLWDEANAEAKLKQQLGQRSDLGYFDFDVLRFNGEMYWTGTTVPVIPNTVASRDTWFNQHFIYTHSDVGMKMLEADTGNIVDESQFFNQRRIYYGESGNGGLFSTYWSAYPVTGTRSEEVGGAFYNGTGGVNVAPPLSWMFEPNFMAYSNTPVHVMRYKDIHDRMELLYPYFVYEFCFDCTQNNPQPKEVEAFVVTDGTRTYWLMPLIVAINTSNVPWSSATSTSFMLQLVGYSLIDAYDGTVQIIVTGNDYFSQMFFEQYRDIGATREVPRWLADQIRYPEEMFIWQISKFNTYHVTDPKAYIETKDFYSIADDSNEVVPYYAYAKPPEFESPEFVGLQPLQLKEPQSNSLVGYMTVQNDLEDLGRMTFFSIPRDSPTKLISPAAAKTTLTGSAEYKEAKRALFGDTNPPLGQVSLYKVGDYEVYFIPVFADTGGKQVGIVGAVGAASTTGTHYVGLGNTPAQAFENYLQKLSGVAPTDQPPVVVINQTAPDRQSKIQNLEKVFIDAGLTVIKPTAVSAPVEFREAQGVYRADSDLSQAEAAIQSFIQEFAPEGGRIFEWHDGTTVNFGVLREVEGIVENHYISIEVG